MNLFELTDFKQSGHVHAVGICKLTSFSKCSILPPPPNPNQATCKIQVSQTRFHTGDIVVIFDVVLLGFEILHASNTIIPANFF